MLRARPDERYDIAKYKNRQPRRSSIELWAATSIGHPLRLLLCWCRSRFSREVLIAVPQDFREAALAVGSTKWESTWWVVVPFARTGILGSIFLALARALGETMAVTMVIGNTRAVHGSLLAPGYTIAAVIANEFAEAVGDLYLSALVELGLVLFALTIIMNGAARLLIIATTAKGTAP